MFIELHPLQVIGGLCEEQPKGQAILYSTRIFETIIGLDGVEADLDPNIAKEAKSAILLESGAIVCVRETCNQIKNQLRSIGMIAAAEENPLA